MFLCNKTNPDLLNTHWPVLAWKQPIFTLTCSKRLHATFHLHMKKKDHFFLFFFFNNYIITECKWDPLGGMWIMPIWPRAGITIIFGWAEGSNEQAGQGTYSPYPLAWPIQLSSRPHHLLFLLGCPRKAQKSRGLITNSNKDSEFLILLHSLSNNNNTHWQEVYLH